MMEAGFLGNRGKRETEIEEAEDGHTRTGTVWTATAHAITTIIGSGVLALPWSVAQLGWIIGPIALIFFAFVTYYCAILLCDCYRSPDPVHGKRNHTYIEAVREILGKRGESVCATCQYVFLWGSVVGYTITAAIGMATFMKTNCFHHKGRDAGCHISGTIFLIIFGALEILLSQFPNMEKVAFLSVIAAAMSFTYSFVSSYLSISKFASSPKFRGSLINTTMGNGVTPAIKTWRYFQALGNIAFAYTYSALLIEIEDTLKSPPAENKTMRRASLYAIATTTLFYVSLGCMGYVAFGDNTPGNILTGFYEPFWLIDIANLAVVIHLITAYQVFAQPIYAINEKWIATKWPNAKFLNHVFKLRLPNCDIQFTLSKLLLRPAFVLVTTLIAMSFPFFNAIVGLLGSIVFWPLTVYFPVSMYIVQSKIKRGSFKWIVLQGLSMICLAVTIVSGLGSIADIVDRLKHATFFHIEL